MLPFNSLQIFFILHIRELISRVYTLVKYKTSPKIIHWYPLLWKNLQKFYIKGWNFNFARNNVFHRFFFHTSYIVATPKSLIHHPYKNPANNLPKTAFASLEKAVRSPLRSALIKSVNFIPFLEKYNILLVLLICETSYHYSLDRWWRTYDLRVRDRPSQLIPATHN